MKQKDDIHQSTYHSLHFLSGWRKTGQVQVIKGSLDEKLPIYERDPKSKRIDS